jgi:hypothetical protein
MHDQSVTYAEGVVVIMRKPAATAQGTQQSIKVALAAPGYIQQIPHFDLIVTGGYSLDYGYGLLQSRNRIFAVLLFHVSIH